MIDYWKASNNCAVLTGMLFGLVTSSHLSKSMKDFILKSMISTFTANPVGISNDYVERCNQLLNDLNKEQ